MSDLVALAISSFDEYFSHPEKSLRVHMNGVMAGVLRRTNSKTAITAALFHDLGKLNQNFQLKLKGQHVTAYSSHAYLSAHAFLCFCSTNSKLIVERLGIQNTGEYFSVLTQIARHHGNLPNMSMILSESERERLAGFLSTNPNLPASDFLQQWLSHQSFDILDSKYSTVMKRFQRMPDNDIQNIKNKIEFFLDVQHSFACLLEADKRDAGNNNWYQREEQLAWATVNFAPSLDEKFKSLKPDSELNIIRTQIRKEATENILPALAGGQRVFSLTAPTGSGKTFTLLSLANQIRLFATNANQTEYSIIYSLPFLTITEQVEDVCKKIFATKETFVTRLDSRAYDPELGRLLDETDWNPNSTPELLQRSFSRETWDAGFIITTFVQLFESLLSNRNATLLKIPNFDRCIFLLDEIQTLPPRLYIFLTAHLQAFCDKYDSYVVLSTATMPALDLPDEVQDAKTDPRKLFPTYTPPTELLAYHKYYHHTIFDRYSITRIDAENSNFTIEDLSKSIQNTTTTALIVLNTIEDSKKLYSLLKKTNISTSIELLNTHFTLEDRRAKIEYCKERLLNNLPIILISTQLIEAGVDIDFPTVYRDLCPLPNLIQTAGRCNRNGNINRGDVYFFKLHGDNGRVRASYVYRDRADGWILDFSQEKIVGTLSEGELMKMQLTYFNLIKQNLKVGDHRLRVGDTWQDDNLIRQINDVAFEVVGSFRLINEEDFGEAIRYYVTQEFPAPEWETLKQIISEIAKAYRDVKGTRLPFAEVKRFQIRIENQLRKMSDKIVQVRIRGKEEPLPVVSRNGLPEIICGLRCLLPGNYSYEKGVDLARSITAIL